MYVFSCLKDLIFLQFPNIIVSSLYLSLVIILFSILIYLYRNINKKIFHTLIWISTFLTFDLIIFGSFTRLTNSGMGCPDWPGCYGKFSPFIARHEINIAEKIMPTGPVTIAKAWIEMFHRYFAIILGILIIFQVLVTLFKQKKINAPVIWPIILLCVILIQGIFGALTVSLQLQPIIVTIHLLLGFILLSIFSWFANSYQVKLPTTNLQIYSYSKKTIIAIILLFIQIVLGGWVSSNYAVLACPDFPLCNGSWIPPNMDFANGFSLWRSLGKNILGENLRIESLISIHWIHRMVAICISIYLIWLIFQIRNFRKLSKLTATLTMLLSIQFLSGVSNVIFKWPLIISIIHSSNAAFMLIILVMIEHTIFIHRPQNNKMIQY